MTDVLTSLQRKFCMSRIQGKDTKPELLLRKALWSAGFRYRLNIKLIGKPDIVFPGKHLAIFVDGCFWHGCPEHYQTPKTNQSFWQKKLEKNIARDKKVNQLLTEKNWKVFRFWEHDIKNNLADCVEQIADLLQK